MRPRELALSVSCALLFAATVLAATESVRAFLGVLAALLGVATFIALIVEVTERIDREAKR